MSHRVTVQTEIKDKAVAMSALKAAKYSFREEGSDVLLITSGKLENVRINLKSGTVSGDTDFRNHSESNLGLLRQNYAEAKFKSEVLKNGGTIEDRSVDKEGNIVIMHAMG